MVESDAFSPSIQTRQRARHLFILNKKYIKCLKLVFSTWNKFETDLNDIFLRHLKKHIINKNHARFKLALRKRLS